MFIGFKRRTKKNNVPKAGSSVLDRQGLTLFLTVFSSHHGTGLERDAPDERYSREREFSFIGLAVEGEREGGAFSSIGRRREREKSSGRGISVPVSCFG